MKDPLGLLAKVLVVVTPFVVPAQASGPQLIDELSMPNAETASARFQIATSSLANRIADQPESMLEFVLRRGQKQSIGEVYRTLGIQRAYFAAEHFDLNRFVWTICQASSEPLTQIWLIDSMAQKHSCTSDDISFTTTSLFVTLSAPNEKYVMGGCCLIDEVDYPASLETVRAFGRFVNEHVGATAYAVVYGGTNYFKFQNGRGREIVERHIDSPRFISKLGKDVREHILAGGLNPSRFVVLDGGYRDRYASIDLWIAPTGGKRPRPTPNYFPKSRRRAKSHM